MKEYPMNNKLHERKDRSGERVDQYDSVEFSLNGLNARYQFKIWNIAPGPNCVLVKEDSEILPRLRVGDTLNLKYYSSGSFSSIDNLETTIRNIRKDDDGRFKGHYLVALEILDPSYQEKIH